MAPKKTTPTPQANVEDDFEAIADALAEQDYNKCIKSANIVLSKVKNDADALKVKLFSHISLGNFEDALQLLDATPPKGSAYERAYCLWKLNRFDECAAVVQKLADSDAVPHLAGLLHIRQGNGEAALEAYLGLVPKVRGDKEAALELAPNVIAALLLAKQTERLPAVLKDLRVSPRDSYEVAFNAACSAVAEGRHSDAQDLLQFADTRGQETLYAEGCSAEEVDRELAVVRAQLAHAQAEEGQTAAALELYLQAASQHLETSDVATAALIANNVAALRLAGSKGTTAPAKLLKDALKKVSTFVRSGAVPPALVASLGTRLSPDQTTRLLANHALLLSCAASAAPKGGASNARSAATAASTLAESNPASQSAALVHAAALAADKRTPDALASLEAWAAAHPDAATRPLLLAAHLAAAAGHPDKVGELLGSELLGAEVRNAPGVLTTRAALADKTAEGPRALLEGALGWWEAEGGSEGATGCAWCLERLGSMHLRSGDAPAALECFNRLRQLKAGGTLPAGVAQKLTRALAALDADAVPDVADCVPKGRDLSALDVGEAEEMDLSYVRSKGASLLFGPVVKTAGQKAREAKEGVEEMDTEEPSKVRARTKRKRSPKYPKNFDPEHPGPAPNPERWLPKYERAEFLKRRKRSQRNQPVSKGAQGMGKVDESLDKSGITQEMLEAKATAAGPQLPPRNAPKGAQGKRKGRR